MVEQQTSTLDAVFAEYAYLVREWLARSRRGLELPLRIPDSAVGHRCPANRFPPLAQAASTYHLSRWEVDLLGLALAGEMDPHLTDVWPALTGRQRPTVALALGIFGVSRPDLSRALGVFSDEGPLRRYSLLEPVGDQPVVGSELRLRPGMWARLDGSGNAEPMVPLLKADAALAGRLCLQDEVRERFGQTLQDLRQLGPRPLVIVSGAAGSGREAAARALAGRNGWDLLDVSQIPSEEIATITPELRRDARWWHCGVLVFGSGCLIPPVLKDLDVPLFCIVGEEEPLPRDLAARRNLATLRIEHPGHQERAGIWRSQLGDRFPGVSQLSHRFRFGPGAIQEAVSRARQRGGEGLGLPHLELACAEVSEARFGSLAQRVACPYGWDALVVSEELRAEIRLALAWMRHGETVFGTWGLGRRVSGVPGLTCLFSGPPGTGKTLTAQVLARELGMVLYRVDLSQIVNKYIGETEKNLARLFDGAREGNALLLFDEADAVFGRRTEVRDAHDRYANVETGFLLQRLEVHDGPVILATNLPQNMDEAFLRRIDVTARFTLPETAERRRIWELHLPPARYCCEDIDLDLIATRFEIAGGDIRNATIAAGLLAADEGGMLAMRHLVRGLFRQLKKSGRMVDPARFGPWREVLQGSLERSLSRARETPAPNSGQPASRLYSHQ